MANEAAFKLASQFEDVEGFGGTVVVGDKTLDVAARLDEGGGTIVTDDQQEIRALDGYPGVVRTGLADAKAAAGEGDALDAMRKDELVRLADEYGLDDVDASSSKAKLIEALRAHDEEVE